MATDELYYPRGSYVPFPSIFATWLEYGGDAPNPCRKFHVSTEIECAGRLAAVALPILRDMKLYHKIVQSRSSSNSCRPATRPASSSRSMRRSTCPRGEFVERLGGALAATPGLRPSPRIPRARQFNYVFMERWLDERMFIYGGFETDPSD